MTPKTLLPSHCQTLVIGGGVIGLSIAYELVCRGGEQIVVIDRQKPAQEASWAGAGILPPGSWYESHPALESLAALSGKLNRQWSQQLQSETHIDNHLRAAGAIHLVFTAEEQSKLETKFSDWRIHGIETQRLEVQETSKLEPSLNLSGAVATYHVPGEAQIDNRQHTRALVESLRRQGMPVLFPYHVLALQQRSNGKVTVRTDGGDLLADRVVLATGCWTRPFGEQLGVRPEIRPVRGQMLDFGPLDSVPIQRIVHHADKYLVPRNDGRVIVGSTVEEVGFDKRTDPEQLTGLAEFARRLVPALADVAIRDSWAGLRPATADGLPYIGPVPNAHNVYVAAGHYRAGLQMASGTAVALADVMDGNSSSSLDLHPFRLQR